MSKPGRNQPCYCGSGKKYKQCHMKIDQAAEREKRAYNEAVRYLRRDLLRFARDEQFATEFAKALPLFWNGLYTVENAEEMSQNEALRFFDWFVFDYLPESGQRLVDTYVDQERDNLSTTQQAVLDSWQNAVPFSAYALTGYEGQTLTLRELLEDAEIEVYESGGRGVVEVGEVILARPVPVADRLEFSTSAAYLPKDEIGDLREKMLEKKTAEPDLSHEAFMRKYNHLLVHHALDQAVEKGRPPVARLDPDRPDKKTQKVVRNMKRFTR